MKSIPVSESDRLKSLHELRILDTAREPVFDWITRLAAQITGCSHSLLTFVDSDRQWFKSAHGLEIKEAPREGGFCPQVILGSKVLIVEDARFDERFRKSPFVTGSPHIRFYAGVPIAIQGGFNVGVICVFDNQTRQLSSMQIQFLKELAQLIPDILKERRTSLRFHEPGKRQEVGVADQVFRSQLAVMGHQAAGLAHEINNPIGVIQLSTALLRKKLAVESMIDHRVEETLGRIEAASARIKKMIRAMNTYSRDSKNDSPIIAKMTDIIDDTLQFCSERLTEEKINFNIEGLDPELEIPCRPVEISQVLLNLIHNSCDAIRNRDEKWIRISIQPHSDSLEISIIDSGQGIPKALQTRIFEPYFTTKKFKNGTGLGLSICQRLIESHSGTLSIDQQSRHTCFVIRLPRKKKMAA